MSFYCLFYLLFCLLFCRSICHSICCSVCINSTIGGLTLNFLECITCVEFSKFLLLSFQFTFTLQFLILHNSGTLSRSSEWHVHQQCTFTQLFKVEYLKLNIMCVCYKCINSIVFKDPWRTESLVPVSTTKLIWPVTAVYHSMCCHTLLA